MREKTAWAPGGPDAPSGSIKRSTWVTRIAAAAGMRSDHRLTTIGLEMAMSKGHTQVISYTSDDQVVMGALRLVIGK